MGFEFPCSDPDSPSLAFSLTFISKNGEGKKGKDKQI
jgi:hypothetical protein